MIPIPAGPVPQMASEAIDAFTEGLGALQASFAPYQQTDQQRKQLGNRVRQSVPLLVLLTALGIERRPELFAHQANAADLRHRQERVRSLLWLYYALRRLTAQCHDAYLVEQALLVDESLAVLRRTRAEEPPHPLGPRRRALREALAWCQAACPFFKMKDAPVVPVSDRDELLVAAERAIRGGAPCR